MSEPSITLCFDDGEGCGGDFSHKKTVGLCQKCTKLSMLHGDPELYAQWKGFKQCDSCGLAMRNLIGSTCGTCIKQGPGVVGGHRERIALEASADARAHAMDVRMSKGSAPAFAPGGALSGGGSGGKSKDIMVGFKCRIQTAKKGTSGLTGDFGVWHSPFHRNEDMADVLEDALQTLNRQWSKKYGMDLTNTEVELRLSGNQIFSSGTETGKLGEIFTKYTTGPLAIAYGQTTKPIGSASGKHAGSAAPQHQSSLQLELYVDQIAASSYPQTRKRAGTESTLEEAAARHKRPTFGKHHCYLSSFIPSRPSSSLTSASGVERNVSHSIVITKAASTCSEDTGEVDVSWPENGDQVTAIIHSTLFAKGRTKFVYRMTIGEEAQLYVAKRFFNIGGLTGSIVTAAENENYLESDFIRLKVLSWFLKQFLRKASSLGIEHYHDISVTNAVLVREVGTPSGVSALPPGDVDGAVWLVEPKRPRAIIKFCGTVAHPVRSDKIALTVQALLHFIFEQSKGEQVYADIQGSKVVSNGREKLVLFDPMSHSPESESGLGDHGSFGISAFIAQHRCDYICKSLGMQPLSEWQPPKTSSTTEDGEAAIPQID
ncbi:kinase-like domain-containing protein [Ephemerocybe angulata]|uniref:Kinase-like domain-containing protein n=1 Tax=Ephemerocybe angulata TaxID=980116 RepID=A0A8H6HTT8_9AGAR|nr:kinase-like domain-containing protein [Tulosesus angulatus]